MPGASSDTAAPMEGRGVYNRSSRVQAAGLSPLLPLFEQAANAVALAGAPEPIVIADYGSSEGRNSLAPMAVAIRALRKRVDAERAISIVHNDLPGNDFSSLFATLADDPESYLRDDAAVFASAVGRSFYEQVLPTASVTLGWSSWALQYLSRAPAPVPDQVHYGSSTDIATRAAYARQAQDDWRTFLTCRGRELRPGGRLVVLTKGLLDDGGDGYQSRLIGAIYAALMKLVDDGFVSTSEVRRMTIPMASRGRADLLAPFATNRRFAGLSIDHFDMFCGDDCIWEEFERDRDASKFGARWAAFSRASVFPTLGLALDRPHDELRMTAFFDRLEAGMAAQLARTPQAMIIPLAGMTLTKDDQQA